MKNTEITKKTVTWCKVENKMPATQAEAPYLGVIQYKDTVTFESFVKDVKASGCSESELEINRVLTKHEELMKDYVAQNYKVYTPFGIAGVHITRSFPAQDAPFDPLVNEAIMAITPNAATRNAAKGAELSEDTSGVTKLKGPEITSVCTEPDFSVIVVRKPFVIAGRKLLLDPTKETDKVTLVSEKTGVATDVPDWTCDGTGFRIDATLKASLAPGKYKVRVTVGGEDGASVLSDERSVTVRPAEFPPLAESPDGLSSVWTLNGKADLSKLDPVPATGSFRLAGAGLDRYLGQTPSLVWGEGEDERVEIAEFDESGEDDTIIAYVGSAEVVLPVGVTTCHLTFGSGDTQIDVGPFKVVREA